MITKILASCVFAACTVAMVGCDKASSAASAAKDTGDAALTKARDEVTKQFGDLGAIETKINALTGDAKTSGLAKLTDFKKMLEDFKTAPMDKIGEWKTKLMTAFADLKKMAGM